MSRFSPNPIELGAANPAVRLTTDTVELSAEFIDRLRGICEVATDEATRISESRDWWFLAMNWAVNGQVPQIAGAIARPADATQVAAVVAACNESGIPVTAAAGHSSTLDMEKGEAEGCYIIQRGSVDSALQRTRACGGWCKHFDSSSAVARDVLQNVAGRRANDTRLHGQGETSCDDGPTCE